MRLAVPADLLDQPGDRSGTPSARFGHRQTRLGQWWDRHPRLLQAAAVVAVVWSLAYLVWRVGWSLTGVNPLLAAGLLAAEVFGLWSLVTLAVFSWRKAPSTRPAATAGRSVDIYVCTYDEPLEVLAATLTGCREIRYPHTTYVLDDGRRDAVAALAESLGARYLTRPDNTHAKAGNINAALPRTGGELVLILDADHVPLPDCLDAVVGYFDDPRCALVQTPHDFYNQDSIQHYDVGRHEQSVFFEVVCPGKDRHGAAFWCGSAGIIRRDALLAVGGVATETIAEDFHTTIKLQRAGWGTRYHDETLVQGLAPHDLAAYLLQRDRWARGNLSVFTTPESPLRARELTAMQRWSYFASLAAYAAGPMRFVSLAVLCASLWTGALPMAATTWALLGLWLPSTLLHFAAGAALSRGHMKVKEAFCFEVSTMAVHLRALSCVVRPSKMKFKVTPKEGIDTGGWDTLRQLRLACGVAVVLAAGLAARALELAGAVALPSLPGIAAQIVPSVAAVELYRLARTLAHLSRRRQYRADQRFECRQPAVLRTADGDIPGHVVDLNRRGAGVEVGAEVPVGTLVAVAVTLTDAAGGTREARASGVVRACYRSGDSWKLGVQFAELSAAAAAAITEFCYVVCVTERLRGLPPHLLDGQVDAAAAAELEPAR